MAHVITLLEGLKKHHGKQVAIHEQSRGSIKVDMVGHVAVSCMQGGIKIELHCW